MVATPFKRSTKLNYGPIEAPNMRKVRRLATDEQGFSHLEIHL